MNTILIQGTLEFSEVKVITKTWINKVYPCHPELD